MDHDFAGRLLEATLIDHSRLAPFRRLREPSEARRNPGCWGFVAGSLWLAVAIWASADEGNRITVGDVPALRSALARATPGSVLGLSDGLYRLDEDLRISLQGTAERPVVIKATYALQARFVGAGRLQLVDCEYVVLRGFTFGMRADHAGKQGMVSLESSRYCRITRNRFELLEPSPDLGNQTWLTIHGERSRENRIDHNLFTNKVAEGYFVFVSGDGMDMSQRDRIDRNHFANRAYGHGRNNFETIRVGESRVANKDGGMFTTISENLFENCSGEDEIVSFKGGDCAFVGNTIVDCHGSIVLRAGSRNTVADNIFIRTESPTPFPEFRAGGVRMYGHDHKVVRNFFRNLDGYGFLAPLNIMPGAPAGTEACGAADCLPATRCEVRDNTWVHCRELRFGYDSDKRPLPPADCLFAQNTIYGGYDGRPPVRLYDAAGISFGDNVVWRTKDMRRPKAEDGLGGLALSTVDPGMPVTPNALAPGDVGPHSR